MSAQQWCVYSIGSIHLLVYPSLSHLPQVQLDVQVFFVSDTLRGDDHTELRVKFMKKLEDAVPAGED